MSVSPPQPENAPVVRIGELSRRTGVGADTLRAWERRYGLLRPERSPGGFRLYGPADEQRVRAMRALIDSGIAAAEAARLAISGATPALELTPSARGDFGAAGDADAPGAAVAAEAGSEGAPADPAGRLRFALESFDEPAANAIVDDAVARFTVDAVINRLLLPVMREIGTRWEAGEISVGQEHFATGVVRGRTLALARNWGAGTRPMALLACPPGERHDVGLVAFGIALHARGWRITYLGADTPIETVARTAAQLDPNAIVLASLSPDHLERAGAELSELASAHTVLVGGGPVGTAAERFGAAPLEGDPVAAASRLAAQIT